MIQGFEGAVFHTGEETPSQFFPHLMGESKGDMVSSLVRIRRAECMGEGVDSTQVCQGLVDRVAHSRQLMAMIDPDLLVLFEDWFEDWRKKP